MQKIKLLTALPLAALCGMFAQPVPAAAAGQEGMTVARDPQTGRLRAPTADEMKALAPLPEKELQAPGPLGEQVVTQPDGSRVLRLGERRMVYSVATRGADGQLAKQCVHGEPAAAGALTHPAATVQNKEHRHEIR